MDIGCGDGLFTSICFDQRIDVGVDINSRELELASQSGAYQKVERADVTSLSYDNETFQTIISNGALEHIKGLKRALAEIGRVLKKGGSLVTTSPSKYYSEFLFYKFIPGYTGFNNRIFSHFNLFDHEEWRKILYSADLDLIEYRYYNPIQIIQIYDLLFPFTFPSFVWKKLLNRYYLFPALRKITAPIIEKLLWKFYEKGNKLMDERKGGSVLLVARKI